MSRPPSSETAAEPSAPWRRTLGVLWFANFVAAAGLVSMLPYLTYFVEELGVTDPTARNRWAGVLVGAAPIVAAFMGPIWGALGDRIGRRVMVLRALVAIAVFVGLMGFATSPWTLLVLRLLQGLFSGFSPATTTFVSVLAPPSEQGRVTGLLQGAQPAGMACGLALGGAISELWGIRFVFAVCSALALMGFAAVFFFTREPDSGRAKGSRPPPLREGWRHVLALPRLVQLLLALIVVRALTSTIEPHYARFVDGLGGSHLTAGLIMGIQPLALLLFMPFWGRKSDRVGAVRTFVLCAIGVGIGMIAQAFVTHPLWLIPCRAVTGAFLAGVFPAAYGLAGRESAPEHRGSAMGIVFMAIALSHAIGSTAGGELLSAMGFSRLFVLSGGVILVAALSSLRVMRRR